MKFRSIVPALLAIGCLKSQSAPVRDPFEITISVAPKKVEDKVLPKQDAVVSFCPDGMVQVKGNYCPNLEEVCLHWLDQPICLKKDKDVCLEWSSPMRCGEFKKPTVCHGDTVAMNFCIDKYEEPNQEGTKPQLQVSWYEAKASCEGQGKRLCVDNEWTQACRGNDNLPYPYGYVRDADACRIDLPWQDYTKHTFEELDKTVPAGSMPGCVSGYGVHDLTGNGDEWAVSSGGTPYKSVLKGGHPYGVRNRCTPSTDGHNESFKFYDIGYRCCKDAQE